MPGTEISPKKQVEGMEALANATGRAIAETLNNRNQLANLATILKKQSTGNWDLSKMQQGAIAYLRENNLPTDLVG